MSDVGTNDSHCGARCQSKQLIGPPVKDVEHMAAGLRTLPPGHGGLASRRKTGLGTRNRYAPFKKSLHHLCPLVFRNCPFGDVVVNSIGIMPGARAHVCFCPKLAPKALVFGVRLASTPITGGYFRWLLLFLVAGRGPGTGSRVSAVRVSVAGHDGQGVFCEDLPPHYGNVCCVCA